MIGDGDADAGVSMTGRSGPVLRIIGRVESSITDPAVAPKQADETAPRAWLVLDADVQLGSSDIRVGDRLVVITWLHRARRDLLRVHPRDRIDLPIRGVFSTRSADRPNPLGLHPVRVVAVDADRILVDRLEAVDGTPIVDIKPEL